MTREEMIKAVSEINGSPYDWKSRDDQAILFLLASIHHGRNWQKIHRVTGIPIRTCQEFGRIARTGENPIWVGQKIAANWHKENGTISLLIDSMVLTGLMARG